MAKLCSFEGCGRVNHARGLCDSHDWQLHHKGVLTPIVYAGGARPGEPQLKKRIPLEVKHWRHVVKNDEGCWGWTGKTIKGYGYSSHFKGRITAHRASWMIHFGPIPEGFCVLHKCDNPPCTRPDHLFLGTIAENNADRAAKCRSSKVTRKLSREQFVRAAFGNEPLGVLAKEFGVTKQCIALMRKGHGYSEFR